MSNKVSKFKDKFRPNTVSKETDKATIVNRHIGILADISLMKALYT